ncbi:unnamed protein product, partial [Aureobasidium vineae]
MLSIAFRGRPSSVLSLTNNHLSGCGLIQSFSSCQIHAARRISTEGELVAMSPAMRWYYRNMEVPDLRERWAANRRSKSADYRLKMRSLNSKAYAQYLDKKTKREAFKVHEAKPEVYARKYMARWLRNLSVNPREALWWQEIEEPEKFVCHSCYTKDGLAAAMLKGHENLINHTRMPWPKPDQRRQSDRPQPEREHPEQSTTNSEETRVAKQPDPKKQHPEVSHKEYLALAYAHQRGAGERYVPFLNVLEEVLEDSITSDEAATRVSAFVLSQEDFLSIYSGVLSMIIGAAQLLSDQRDLFKLADLVLALSRLPDVRNESNETLRLYHEPKTYTIAPQEVITVDNGKIWCGLPSFSTELGDSMRDPTAYINDGVPEHIAEQQWTNQNTFAAYVIFNTASSSYSFDYLYTFAFRCIADSLEWDARTEQGMFSGYEIATYCGRQALGFAGPLWRAYWEDDGDRDEEDGINAITEARWLWWARRLNGLGQSNIIDEEAKAMAVICAEMIRRWVAEDEMAHQG